MLKTRRIDWIVCSVVFVIGLILLGLEVFSDLYGTTPESELTTVEGSASEAQVSRIEGTSYVRFTVNHQTVDYSSDMPGYTKVVEAIKSATPMSLGISTKQETLFPRDGWVPLYTLAIGAEVLLTYQDTVGKGYRSSHSLLYMALVLLCISGWGFWTSYRNRNAKNLTLEERAAAWQDPRRARMAALLFSIAIYSAVLFALLHPDSMPTSIKVFGESPLGLPLRLFLWMLITIVLLPLPIAAWHGYQIIFRFLAGGGRLSKLNMVRALVKTPAEHEDLRRSRNIVLGIFAFYVGLIVAWIVYADSHGL